MQSNANSDASKSLIDYGPDTSKWPQDAQDRRTAAKTGWDYVAAVRQRSDAMETAALPNDPTDDSHWPTRIPPVYIG
jgi:hypothetical protein